MAFASTGTIGTSIATIDYSSLIANTIPIPAGRLVIVAVAKDNQSSSDGSTSEIMVFDNVNNAYIKLYENTNSNGAAGAGVTTSLWYSVLSSTLPPSTGTLEKGRGISGGINIINQTSVSKMVASAWGFSFNNSQNMIALDGTTTAVADAAAFGSMTLSSLANKEHLFVRVTGSEGTSTPTVTASHSAITTCSVDSAMQIWGEYRILTATTDTSNPTTTGSLDNSSVFVAFSEKVAVTPMFFASNF